MKNVFKTGLFYFIAFSMVFGNSIVSIDFSTAIANAEELEIKPEVLAEKITFEPYHVPEMVSVVFDASHENATINWNGTDDLRLDGYKVLISITDPNPTYDYPGGGGGYIVYITDGSTEFIHNYTYECGVDYYFSVTSLYDGHTLPNQFVPALNPLTLNFACEESELATVIAHKIICDEETDLPNWYGGANITADTAQNYVNTHPNCRFASDWKFEWGTNNSLLDLDGDYVGEHNVAGWYDFDSLTDVNGKAEVELNLDNLSGKTWFREVLQDGYLLFSFPTGEKTDNVSAEFWCNSDVVNYDNAEWIDDIAADNTYYCVAFNVQEEDDTYCELELTKSDEGYEQVLPGDELVYTLSITNTGTANCTGTGVKVRDVFDSNTSYVSAIPTPREVTDEYVEWNFGTITPGQFHQMTLTMVVFEQLECDSTLNNTAKYWSSQTGWGEFINEETTIYCEEDPEECSLEDSLLTNGSFEEPEVTDNSLWQKMSFVLGWVIEKMSDDSATTLELHRAWSGNAAAEGLQYSELDGDHSTRVVQNVDTEEGAEYKLFWSFAPRHNIAAEQNHLAVKVGGIQVATNSSAAGSAPLAQEDWIKSSYVFIAGNINTELAFEDIGPSNSFGTFLDDVRLCKISDPEPSDNIPVITLIGSPIINVDHNSVYTDEGATANDVEDGNLTPNIATVNPVNTSVAGTYTVTYNVDDSDTNSAVEVTRTVIVDAPYAPWCSALLGAMRDYYREGTSAYRVENDVIDINNDGDVSLSDLGLLATMYFAGDNDECYAQFENPTSNEREFYFQCEDEEVGWCGGLIQGIKDSYGSSKGDANYFHVFDLNDDGDIGLIDHGLATTLYFGEDQSACYPYYVPPFLMCEDTKTYCGDGQTQQPNDNGQIEQCDGDEPIVCTIDGYLGEQSCNMPSGEPTLQSVEQLYCILNECVTEYSCGDGYLQDGDLGPEQCDDGNLENGDGCNSSCKLEDTPPPPCVGCGGGTTFAIRDLDSSVSCSAFDISWRTTKYSDTILDFGIESGVYTENIDNDTNTKNHSLELTDLLPDTTYFYQVRAISTSNGLEKKITEKTFTTPTTEQCGEVLGEKIVDPEPLICDFLRASGSRGIDLDIDGVFQYPNGTLLRDACDRGEGVYLVKDQKKWHIPNWKYLHDNYFGQRIYNVLPTVLDIYPNWTGQVLGTKIYADGSLLRASNMKIYVLEKGHKQHINSLEKLAKYSGQEIIDVSDEVINRY